jgi:hypothetical protein
MHRRQNALVRPAYPCTVLVGADRAAAIIVKPVISECLLVYAVKGEKK